MPIPAFSKTLSLKFLQSLAASALLLLSTTALHAAQEALLRLDPGGHTAKVGNLLITLDGKLVTASDDKTIRIWNPKNGREERKILGQLGPGAEGMIFAIALSPDGKLLASGGYFMPEDVIRLHDFHSGELLQILKGHENAVQNLAFSPDERWLVSGSGDKTVRLWKRSGSRFTAGPVLQGHEREVYAVRLAGFRRGWCGLVSAHNPRCGWSCHLLHLRSSLGRLQASVPCSRAVQVQAAFLNLHPRGGWCGQRRR